MPINPGRLRTYASLEQMIETPDPYGQLIQGWRAVGAVMIWDRTPAARDLVNADSLTQIRNHVVVMRHDPRVVPTSRFRLLDGRILRVVEIMPADQQTWLQTVICVDQRDEDPAGDQVEDSEE